MTARAMDCDPRRIAGFVSGELSDFDCHELEMHLDHCARCRAELETRTATPEEWNELQSSLSHGLSHDGTASDEDSETRDTRRSLEQDLKCYQKLLGPSDDPRMLGRIGTYEIVGLLGRGGMGVVFKAFDGTLNRYVAIKLLAPMYLASGAAKQRFVREARSAAAVIHENVVGIHSIAEWQGMPYLVMTFVRGGSLQKRLSQRGALSLKEVLRIGLQVAQGLSAAHTQGLMHRDVKPGNILLEADVDRVKITDFGLARATDDIRITGSDLLLGTPEYMSPEQARDETLDYRTDLFSLGAVLYEACTGRSPFRASTVYGAIRKVIDHTPPPVREVNAEMPDWLDTIIARLLAKDATKRIASAAEVASLLQQCLAHVEQPRLAALPESLTRRTTRWQRASSRRMIVTVSLALAAFGAGWLTLAQLSPVQPPERPGNNESVVLAVNDSSKTSPDVRKDESPPATKHESANEKGLKAADVRRDASVTMARNDFPEDTSEDRKDDSSESDAGKAGKAANTERKAGGAGALAESAVASDDDEKSVEVGTQSTVTVGNFQIRLRKVDGVQRHQMSIKMDPARLFGRGNTSSDSSFGNRSTQTTGSGDGRATTSAGGSVGGFSGGRGSVFTSSGGSTSGRPFSPTLGLAFDIEPKGGRGAEAAKSRKGKKESSSASAIVEIGQNLIATGENGQKLEHQADNPMTMRSLEFEASVPGAFTVYLEETQQVSKLATLKGELLVTPGRLLIAEFDGAKKQTRVVDGETFAIESVSQGPNGTQVAVTLPQTTRQKRARTFEEQFRVLSESMGSFDVTIEDDAGTVYPSLGGGSAGGSSGGSSSGGGVSIGGTPQATGNGHQTNRSSQTFNFGLLPQDRTIKKIRVRMTDRTGEPKSHPFSMKEIPVPFPN